MKWSFVIQQKLKTACLLCGIMLMIILGTVISRNNIQGVSQSFSSIYSDRLIPATTIIYLSENLYGKRLAIEKCLFSEDQSTAKEMSSSMETYRHNTDSLLAAFSKTLLTEKEFKSLEELKKYNRESIGLETKILNFHNLGNNRRAREIFEKEGLKSFHSSIESLNNLASIQSEVGKELMKESKKSMANMILISFFQIALAIVVGIMILALIKTSKIIDHPTATAHDGSYFHLN